MLRSVFAVLTGAILLLLGFMFSVVLLGVIAVLGLAVWAYLWWQTRKIRRTMQQQRPTGGDVIEGEAVVVEEYRVTPKDVLPDDRPPQ